MSEDSSLSEDIPLHLLYLLRLRPLLPDFSSMHQLLARIGVLEQREANFILQAVRPAEQNTCLVDLLVTKNQKVQRNLWRMLDITSQVSLDVQATEEDRQTYRQTRQRNQSVGGDAKLAESLAGHSEFQVSWQVTARLWVDPGSVSAFKVREDFTRSVVAPLLARWQEVAPSVATVGNVVRTLRRLSLDQTAEKIEDSFIRNS